jgi:hypothetical protein
MPKCSGIKNDGAQCTHPPLRGFDKCRHHLRGVERDKSDCEREQRYLKTLELGDIPLTELRARRGLASIARRRFHKLWIQDPRIEGETITFALPQDHQRALQWLIDNCCIDVSKPLPGTTRIATPRCLDRLLWVAWRVVRSEDKVSDQFIENAKRRVAQAIRDDMKFWKRWDAAGGDAG